MLGGGGCGKKGPPLPPLLRIPAAPADVAATRIEDDVYLQFTTPIANVDGVGPANVARVEVYAITADRVPDVADPEDLRRVSTLIDAVDVRRPPPPLPPVKEGMPPVPLPPQAPGVDQGAPVVSHETLTPDAQVPAKLPPPEDLRGAPIEPVDLPVPLIAPSVDSGPQRYYFVVAVTANGRYGAASALTPVPLGPTSSAPPAPAISVTETALTLRWMPAADVRGVPPPVEPDVLPSRPVLPGSPPTTYDVYEVSRNATPAAPTPANATPAVPTPLTPEPVGALEFTQTPITLGTERCFVVRPVDIISGIHVRGPASPPVCADFADTFAPSPAGTLDAVATQEMISLIWEPSTAPDLAGYLVLRGEVADATLTPLTKELVTSTTYRDDSVRPGTRYVYAVVALDKAGNRSAESNRVEETARQ